MDDIVEAVERGMSNALARFGRNRGQAEDTLLATAPILQAQVTELAPIRDFAAETAALEAAKAQFAAERVAFAQTQYWAQAEAKVTGLITAGHVLPAQNQPDAAGQPRLVAAYAAAYADDAAGAAVFAQAGGSRVAALDAILGAVTPGAALTREAIPAHVLDTPAAKPAGSEVTPERKAVLLHLAGRSPEKE